jgi:hypothetical protein
MAKLIMLDREEMINHINWHHVDGPMLVTVSGHIRWLTMRERFLCWIGIIKFFEANPIERTTKPEQADTGEAK